MKAFMNSIMNGLFMRKTCAKHEMESKCFNKSFFDITRRYIPLSISFGKTVRVIDQVTQKIDFWSIDNFERLHASISYYSECYHLFRAQRAHTHTHSPTSKTRVSFHQKESEKYVTELA